jgi:hypothetical protein
MLGANSQKNQFSPPVFPHQSSYRYSFFRNLLLSFKDQEPSNLGSDQQAILLQLDL